MSDVTVYLLHFTQLNTTWTLLFLNLFSVFYYDVLLCKPQC